MSKNTIKPEILKGFRDMLPEVMNNRLKIIEKVRAVFERFGFVPLETPGLEKTEVLTGKYGDEGSMLMYSFKDKGERNVSMRYDLTVPLARVVAQYQDKLPRPFKRYQIAPVYRADKPQKGRFREFYQCDVDIVGSSSMTSDAECVFVDCEVMKALGIKDFEIRINNRKLLNGFIESIGVVKEKFSDVLVAIDKLGKIGEAGVEKELNRRGIADDKVKLIIDFLKPKGEDNLQILERLGNIADNKTYREGFGELRDVINLVNEDDEFADNIKVDVSVARGLAYYTGTVFETFVKGYENIGSVMSGGRYDKLIGMFLSQDIPALGISLGFDRLYVAMDELRLLEKKFATADVLVTFLDENLKKEYFKIAKELRNAGIKTEIYSRPKDKISKQLSYAEKISIPYAVILGDEEMKRDEVKVKNMKAREEKTVGRDKLIKKIKDSSD